jgi:hypothetical protein
MRIRLVPLALVTTLVCTSGLFAQSLPPPRVLPPPGGATLFVMPPAGRPLPPMAGPPPGYRPSAYQVWQYYGVNYQGWLVPRVIQVQGGGYYLYNGYLFPYVNVYPGEHFNPIAKE